MNPIVRVLKLLRRKIYSMRILIPGLKELHRIEAMVGPLGVWNVCSKYQLNCLRQLGLRPKHFLADIGCGPLQGGVAFINYLDESKYYGIDKNPDNLDEAYRLVRTNDLSKKHPNLILSDTFGYKELNKEVFDFFWISQVFYYFTKKYIIELLKMVLKHSHKDSVIYGDIIGPEHYENKTHEHGWILHTIDSLDEICRPMGFTVQSCGRIADYGYPKRLALAQNILVKISYK